MVPDTLRPRRLLGRWHALRYSEGRGLSDIPTASTPVASCSERATRRPARRQVLVEDDLAAGVENAQVHTPGMEIDATVESVLAGVEAHTWSSSGHGSGA